jgi:LysM repeat protein
MAVTSGGKAYFVNVDAGGTFYVQFNPKELKLEDTASWKSSDEQGKPKPLLTYEKGEAAVLSMDLIFDTTDSGGSVQGRIDALRAFLAATVTDSDEGGTSKRPPHINFHWASFSFEGVCEKISASVLMFKPDGTPMRAKVSVTLKERQVETGGAGSTASGSQVTLSALGSMISGAAVNATTTTVQPNQTLSQAAAANNTDFRTMAMANPQVTDPMEMNAGQQLVVPGNNQLASVLANQALSETPANFAPVGDIDPFGNAASNDAGDFGGDLSGDDNDLSTIFQSSGLQDQALSAVDQGADAARGAIDQIQDRAHDLLGDPDFQVPAGP